MKKVLILLACLSLVLCGCGSKTVTVKTNSIYKMNMTFDSSIVKEVSRAYDDEYDEYYFYYKDATIYFDDVTAGADNLINGTFDPDHSTSFKESHSVKIGSYEGYAFNESEVYAVEDGEEEDYYFRTPIVCRANGHEVTIWVVFFGAKEDVEEFVKNTKISFKGLIA